MMNHQAPEGYIYSTISKPKTSSFYNIGTLKPAATFTGAHLQGIVYELTNKTKKTITLKPSYFYNPKICAVALLDQTLQPKGTTYVFAVIQRGDNS